MLNKFLIANTRPIAKKDNVVLWRDYRITVLSDRLFRLEKSTEHSFRDDATLSIWYRDMPSQNYSTRENKDSIVIYTDKVTLTIKTNRKNCLIDLGQGNLPINNDGNLFGTYSTLDCCDGKMFHKNWRKENEEIVPITLENGVCSFNGVAVYDDSESLTLDSNGEVQPTKANGSDEYIFAYGNDYEGAVKALYMISGNTPVVPKYALGNWWSRYFVYTDREYLKVLNYFSEEEVPLTVATIDMDWHYSTKMEEDLHITELGRNKPEYGGNNGWTGYSWNKRLFPHPEEFLKTIHDKNLKITLNLHPADGVRWWEDCYEDMAKAMGQDPKLLKPIPFDIASPKFINEYFDKIHRPLEKQGVDFWWIDWQQGNKSNMEGLKPLWALNHYHYYESAFYNKNPLILSRYCGIGSHRYPVGFSGDTIISWETLKFLPYFTSTATNAGYTWWSHDIGGHMMGIKDDELYIRHLQFGVFSPINRLHSTSSVTCTKEPWAYTTGEIAKQWLRFRHSMIPFLFTCSYNTHTYGDGLIKPLYYKWQDRKAFNYDTEYIFGEQMIVMPITTKVDKNQLIASEKMYIPKGEWTDIFTGTKYDGGKDGREVTIHRTIQNIPVLIKAGGILTLSADKGNAITNPKSLEVRVYQGKGEFTLYENGDEINHDGEFFTHFESDYSVSGDKSIQTLTISSKGDSSVIPDERIFKIRFSDIDEGEISLTVDGEKVTPPDIITSCPATDIVVKPNKNYVISITYEKLTPLQNVIKYANRVLTIAQGSTDNKRDLFLALKKATSIDDYLFILDSSSLVAPIVKDWLRETI